MPKTNLGNITQVPNQRKPAEAVALAGTGAIVLGGLLDSFFGRRGTVESISNINKFSSIVMSAYKGLVTSNRQMMFVSMPKCFQNNPQNPQETRVQAVVGGADQNQSVNKSPGAFLQDLPFFGVGTSLPGLQLQTTAMYQQGYGPITQVPTSQRFDDVDAVFYCDSEGMVFNFFHKWMQSIVNFNATSPAAGGSYEGAYPFEFSYRNDFTAKVQIVVYNPTSDVVVVYELQDAYPAVMGSVSLNWEAQDQILLLPITFRYTSWTSNTLYENSQHDVGRNLSFIDMLIRSGTAAQTASGLLKKPSSIADLLNTVYTTQAIRSVF